VIVAFTTHWCEPSRRSAAEFRRLSETRTRLNFITVDVEDAEDLAPSDISLMPAFHVRRCPPLPAPATRGPHPLEAHSETSARPRCGPRAGLQIGHLHRELRREQYPSIASSRRSVQCYIAHSQRPGVARRVVFVERGPRLRWHLYRACCLRGEGCFASNRGPFSGLSLRKRNLALSSSSASPGGPD